MTDGRRTMDSKGLELRSLQRQVHDMLLAQIVRGELQAGNKISPASVAASLGISVTPVRDAVNLLAAEGLVEVHPRRGTIVAPVSARDVAELYEIRMLIEPAAAALASERATDEDVAEIRELAEYLESAPPGRRTITDLDRFMTELSVDQDFHARVVRAAGNARLASVYEGLRSHLLLVRITFPELNRNLPHRRGEHQRVAAAIATRDPAAARAAMTTHLEHTLADLLSRMEDVTAVDGSGDDGTDRSGARRRQR